MNNEPVAWLYRIKNTDNSWELSWIRPITNIFDAEPLYTHPAKTLTDEEILEVAQKMGWRGALGFLINFARAILKKASEK